MTPTNILHAQHTLDVSPLQHRLTHENEGEVYRLDDPNALLLRRMEFPVFDGNTYVGYTGDNGENESTEKVNKKSTFHGGGFHDFVADEKEKYVAQFSEGPE